MHNQNDDENISVANKKALWVKMPDTQTKFDPQDPHGKIQQMVHLGWSQTSDAGPWNLPP